MMRGKSPRSDVEMTKKKKLSWRPSLIFDGYFSINFAQTWYTHIKFTSDYVLFFAQYSNVNILELFKKNSFLTIYIHFSKSRNSLKNCSIDQIFFLHVQNNPMIFLVLESYHFLKIMKRKYRKNEFCGGHLEANGQSMREQQLNWRHLANRTEISLSKKLSELLVHVQTKKNCSKLERKVQSFAPDKRASCSSLIHHLTVYCCDIPGLVTVLGVGAPGYDPKDWRLFIDSSKRTLKCVLLDRGHFFIAIPIVHSVSLKEKYEHIKTVLQLLKYEEHKWIICVDLKNVKEGKLFEILS